MEEITHHVSQNIQVQAILVMIWEPFTDPFQDLATELTPAENREKITE